MVRESYFLEGLGDDLRADLADCEAAGLRIKASGRVDVMGLASGTGDPCADGTPAEVAGALWYHWLPNDRAPAPVLVEQP